MAEPGTTEKGAKGAQKPLSGGGFATLEGLEAVLAQWEFPAGPSLAERIVQHAIDARAIKDALVSLLDGLKLQQDGTLSMLELAQRINTAQQLVR